MQKYLMVDYETRSEAPLPEIGAHEYAVHPSTRVMCAAWKLGTLEDFRTDKAKTKLWNTFLEPKSEIRHELIQALSNPAIIKVAQNAGFEQVITKYVLPKHYKCAALSKIPNTEWRCTAAMAAAHALPRDLARACMVLRLQVQKDEMGKTLIRRHCIPQKPTKKRPGIWNDDEEGLRALGRYCATDIDAQIGVLLALPPLTASEQKVWELNQRINTRGVYVDRQLVKTALAMIKDETGELTVECMRLTGWIEPTRREAIRKWLAENGAHLPNMQAQTLSTALAAGLGNKKARRVLEIRQSISKTSTAKYIAVWQRSRDGSRLRDLQLYHGASTGREAGTGFQPHNLPRPTLANQDEAIATILTGDRAWVRAIYGDVMAALSSVIRGCLMATPGYDFYCGDFNAIEARIVFWLADHQAGLDMFASGGEPYKEQAALIYRKELADITDEERFVGKESILGSGFQMGWSRFKEQCEKRGVIISKTLAKKAIAIYRERHKPVVKLWYNYERAAIAAVENPGKRITINHTTWFVRGKFLYCQLPSGRCLAYFGARVKWGETPWGAKKRTLYHWGVNSETKQWEFTSTYGGLLTENVAQGVARDCMVEAQLRTEDKGYIPLISVHDELGAERKKDSGTLKEFQESMAIVPAWAPGLPILVKAWREERYRK